MTKANLPPSGKASGLNKPMAYAARFLAAFIYIYTLAAICPAQRTDNRRLFWTGGDGDTWDNTTTASWMTTGSFLAYVNTNSTSAVWLTYIPGTGEPVVAEPATTFVRGDVVIFDSWADTGATYAGGVYYGGDPSIVGSTRTINIASEGVQVSDIVVNAVSVYRSDGGIHYNEYVFTGGAISADPSYVAPGSVQLTGTGVGAAGNSTRPTGSLYKIGDGTITLSNTAANHFAGGIHLLDGTLSITDNRALGNNTIITQYRTDAGGVEARWGAVIGEELIKMIQRPGYGGGNFLVPAVVTRFHGSLHSGAEGMITIHVASSAEGLDITGDIYLGSRTINFNIDGDTTISGRILGNIGDYGATGGTIFKNGQGTLTITGSSNVFYGSSKNYNQLNEGRVVITTPNALGTGATSINVGAVLEFRGVVGTMRQSFIGGGEIEITERSDVTFNWRNGTLDGFDDMSGNGSWHPASNDLSIITISGQSRFSAIASGTYTTVLGGAQVYVKVTEGSSLVLGREGLSARGSGATKIPMTYAILAGRIDLSQGSSIVLNPNAYLSAGALVVADDSLCAITFGASGVSRLRWQEGESPDSIFVPTPENPNPDSDVRLRYIIPAGMRLYINEISVPVSPNESIPADNSSSGYCREYVLVNQGANPLKDIALTLTALDSLHATISTRLADELIDPVANHVPSRGRKWVNQAWIRYIHSEIEYDAGDITTPGMDGRISHVAAGFDGILPGRVILGIHLGMGDNSLDTTNDTNLSSRQKFIGVHVAQRFGKVHIAASAAMGKASTDSFRMEGGNSIRGKWDTSYYSASIEAGVTLSPWRQFSLRPYAGLRYSNLKVGNYYERGLSPLVIDDFSDTSAQALFGLAASHKRTLFKRDVVFNLSLGRKHAVKTPRGTLATHYFDSPTTPVTLERGDYYSGMTAAGLSARVAVTPNAIVGLSFDYETASSYNRMTASVLAAYTW